MDFEEMETRGRMDESSSSSKGGGHCGCNLTCVCQVVRAIKDIQDEAVDEECTPCTTNCFIEPLGDLALPSRNRADTRVITLTHKNGELFKGFYRSPGGKCVSVFFRVEDVFDNCCATLRVLIPLKADGKTVVDLFEGGKFNYSNFCDVRHWAGSNSCITVDLHCFCAIQCISDVNLMLCD